MNIPIPLCVLASLLFTNNMTFYLCGQYVHEQFILFPTFEKSFNFMTQADLKKKKTKSIMLFLEINIWFSKTDVEYFVHLNFEP